MAELGVPYILMHSYGTAQTMVAEAARLDGVVDVCAQVAAELAEAGAWRWRGVCGLGHRDGMELAGPDSDHR